jgi:hypothetical protein
MYIERERESERERAKERERETHTHIYIDIYICKNILQAVGLRQRFCRYGNKKIHKNKKLKNINMYQLLACVTGSPAREILRISAETCTCMYMYTPAVQTDPVSNVLYVQTYLNYIYIRIYIYIYIWKYCAFQRKRAPQKRGQVTHSLPGSLRSALVFVLLYQ